MQVFKLERQNSDEEASVGIINVDLSNTEEKNKLNR